MLIDTFDQHRSDPGKAFDTYAKERRLQLGNTITGRYKVYLDTKYWLLLRDHILGVSSSDSVARLSGLLHGAVASTQVICPISESVFLEVMKQTDTTTLRCTAQLVDTLSCGVSLLASEERVRLELLYFMLKNLHGEASCHPLSVLVWTKLAYTLGLTYPTRTPFAPDEELVVQKALLDHMWEVSLCDILDVIGIGASDRTSDFGDLTVELNEGKEAHADENDGFREMFMSELAGVLDAVSPMIDEVAAYLFECETGEKPTAEEIASGHSQTLMNLIYHGFGLSRITTDLPGIRIPATIHAAVRCDNQRKYKPNDFHDFNHAGAALPYCDMFLTEKSLKHLLTRRDLALDAIYGCRVISETSDAVADLQAVLASRIM